MHEPTISRARFAGVLAAATLLCACVTQNGVVQLPPRSPTAPRVSEGDRIAVEALVDGRGIAHLGRMRNGYLWPMAYFVLPPDRSLEGFATEGVVALLRSSGFEVADPAALPPDALVVRGRLLRAYADFIYTLHATTRVQIDLWRGDRLLESRTYDGFANPFELVPVDAGTEAFAESFAQLFSAMAVDLPPRIVRHARSAGGAQ